MTDFSTLSRRERQIMNAIYALGQATVAQIQEQLPDPPSTMAVRRMVSILDEKGHLKRKKQGREYVYLPKQPRRRAGTKALQQVLDTFFEGSLGSALANHLARPGTNLSQEDLQTLTELINHAKREGR